MAIAKIEGFDLVANNADLTKKGFAFAEGAWGAATGRFGGSGYALSASADLLNYNSTFFRFATVGFWFKTGILSTVNKFFVIQSAVAGSALASSSFDALSVGYTGSGEVTLYGNGGILLASSVTGVLASNTWYWVEIEAEQDGAGTSSVYIGDVLAVTTTGDFVANFDASTIIFVGNSNVHTYDDIAVQFDASSQPSRLGAIKIQTIFTDADTAQADWAGTYDDINDPIGSADGDASYISAITLNAKSEFSLGNLPDSPSVIHAVQIVTEARKTDAGSKAVTPYVVSNSVRGNGTEFAASETYSVSNSVIELNPDTGLAWTDSDINALILGVEITI